MPTVQVAGMSMAGMGARARMFAANKSGGGGKRGARVGPFTARGRQGQEPQEPFVRSPGGAGETEHGHHRDEEEGEMKEEWDPLEEYSLSSPLPGQRTEDQPFVALLPPFKPLLPVPEQSELGSETQWVPDPEILERRLSIPQLPRKGVWQSSPGIVRAPASPAVIEDEEVECGENEACDDDDDAPAAIAALELPAAGAGTARL